MSRQNKRTEREPRLARKIQVAKEHAGVPKKRLPTAKLIASASVVIVFIILAALVLNYESSIGLSQLPSFQNLGASPKQVLANLPGLQGYDASQQLSNFTLSHLARVSELTVVYSGMAYAHGNGAASLLAFNSPINVFLSKYGQDRRFSVNLTSASVLGDISIIYASMFNSTFICENFNATAASLGNQNGVLFGSREMHCSSGNLLLGVNLGNVSVFDPTQLASYGITPRYTSVYQSEYRGLNCTYLSGTISQVASNGTNEGSGKFGMCLSDQYYVPLSLSAIFSGNAGSFSFYLNETSISNSSSQQEIAAMPANVT